MTVAKMARSPLTAPTTIRGFVRMYINKMDFTLFVEF